MPRLRYGAHVLWLPQTESAEQQMKIKDMINVWPCLVVMWLAGCADTRVVLLPDAGGHVGNVMVTADGTTTTLAGAGSTAERSLSGLHESRTTPAAVQADAPALFAAEPAPAASELVYFKNDSVVPVTGIAAFIHALRQDCGLRQPCRLTVIGHTDTVGEADYNMQLSLRRAQGIRARLISAGFTAESLQVRSHGENDPLINTAKGVPEPRNRRVEVMVH